MRKTIIIDQQITIATTPETVFAYACDYRNDPCWRSGVRQMSINSQGGTHAGDRTQEVMRVLGRTTRTEAIITAHEPDEVSDDIRGKRRTRDSHNRRAAL